MTVIVRKLALSTVAVALAATGAVTVAASGSSTQADSSWGCGGGCRSAR